MPIVGIVDPSYAEYDSDIEGRWPRWETQEDILHIASAADPDWSPWPYETLAAAFDTLQDRGKRISTTALLGCTRGEIIGRCEPYIATVDSLYAALQGTMVHRTLELAQRPHAVAEWRFFTTLRNGVEISCSPDLVTPNSILDWKRTDNPPSFSPWRKHTIQVQANRYIVNHATKWECDKDNPVQELPWDPHSLAFEHCALVYLTPKKPIVMETLKSMEVTTPTGKTVKRKMPYVWTDEEVEAEILDKAAMFQYAMESYPHWPAGAEDVWGGEAGWKCPGPPLCYLPNCLAKRWPNALYWENK
jgi:hypothetical protein